MFINFLFSICNRNVIFTSFTLIFALTVGYCHAKTNVDSIVNDPIYLLDFDARQTHFESVKTTKLLPACNVALDTMKPTPESLTLYAEYHAHLVDIYIAGLGADIGIFVLRAGTCTSGIPNLALLRVRHNPPRTYDAPTLSEDEVQGVFSDSLRKYAMAFGGKLNFLRWLDDATEKIQIGCAGKPEWICSPTFHGFPSTLQNELKNFREAN